MLHDHVQQLETQGYAPSYVKGVLKAVKSWLSYNYVDLKRKIRVANADMAVTLQDERVPTREELKAILNHASIRARASAGLIAFAGLRPQVLGNASASDGLTVRDIPDLKIVDGKVVFQTVPAMVIVRSTLSKAKHRYFTFLTSEGCEYVAAYLDKRIAAGETINESSAVITLSQGYLMKGKNKDKGKKFVTTPAITKDIREAMVPVIKVRPYVLRAYFDTQLLLAESQGKIAHAYRQFFMGHKGDIEARYTTNKGRLPDELLTDMRRAFRESERFLSTATAEVQEQDRKQLLLEMWREQAKLYGIDPMKIKIEKQREDGSSKPLCIEDEMLAIKEAITKARELNEEGKYESRLVSDEEELVSCVRDGWDIVKELRSGKVLVRRKKVCCHQLAT
ncbi:hypothetical protein [Nitrososphaera sp.]|uniref:hypothetical protein n=1 Tax=Nitrososphaera sp. TaxID=1971748 RepID=UPI00307D60AA